MLLAGCAASGDRRATEDVGPVTAYARNTLAEENPVGLLRLGEGFERAGDYVGARKLYGQAMAVDPSLAEARIAYARASAKLGRGDEAVAVLTLLLADEPENRRAVFALATVHADAARYQSARSLMEGMSEPGPADLLLLGKLRHVLGDTAAAQAALTAALDAAPNSADALEAAALSFALTGDYASAVALLRRAMDQPARATEAQKSLALVYALSGQREAALRLARDVMPVHEVRQLEAYYRFLPRFSPQEQAAAVFFNNIPTDTIARLTGSATN